MAAAVKVKVELLDESAKVPSRAHTTDTGYDLEFTGVDKIVGDVIFFKTFIHSISSRKHYCTETREDS